MDLEKVFDGVPREMIRWAMPKLGVEERLASAVMFVYTGAKTLVRTDYGPFASAELFLDGVIIMIAALHAVVCSASVQYDV